MGTLASLEVRLDRVAKRLVIGISDLVEDVARGIAEELIPATPVDTGFARGNWRPSLNAPSSEAITFLDPTGAATIQKIINVGKRFRPGDTLFIVNRAPYIANLNAGSSPQAPEGFIEDAVQRGSAAAFARAQLRGIL